MAAGERPGGNFVQRLFAHIHITRFFAQARAAALRAGAVALVLRQFFAHGGRIGFAVAPLEVGQNAFKSVLAVEGGAAFG